MALYSRDGELKQIIDRDEAEDAFDRLANEAKKFVNDYRAKARLTLVKDIVRLTEREKLHWDYTGGKYRTKIFGLFIEYTSDSGEFYVHGTDNSEVSDEIYFPKYSKEDGKEYEKLLTRLGRTIVTPCKERFSKYIKKCLLGLLIGNMIMVATHFAIVGISMLPPVTADAYECISEDASNANVFLPYSDWFGLKCAKLKYNGSNTVSPIRHKDGWYLKDIRVESRPGVKQSTLENKVLTVPMSKYSEVESRNSVYQMIFVLATYTLIILVLKSRDWYSSEKKIKIAKQLMRAQQRNGRQSIFPKLQCTNHF